MLLFLVIYLTVHWGSNSTLRSADASTRRIFVFPHDCHHWFMFWLGAKQYLNHCGYIANWRIIIRQWCHSVLGISEQSRCHFVQFIISSGYTLCAPCCVYSSLVQPINSDMELQQTYNIVWMAWFQQCLQSSHIFYFPAITNFANRPIVR